MSKTGQQIAALPLRWKKNGKIEILLITSRDSGRWVLPKGWPMEGTKPWRAAEIEAMEEAGIRGHISRKMIGRYRYDKGLDNGELLPCEVALYPMIVEEVLRDWKERHERKRHWFSVAGAANAVNEPSLVGLLETLETKPHKQPVIRSLLKAS